MNPNPEVKKDWDYRVQYINKIKLNSLFKEMINTLVHHQPEEPIPYMVNSIYIYVKNLNMRIN
jgi:hypothetical protein